jgi:hypothetical protein
MTGSRVAVRVLGVLFGVALSVVALAVIDRVVIARANASGPFPPPMPPNTRVEFHTTEFQWATETNDLGLRDRRFDWARKTAPRILAIGDSFTLGWGVAGEESWPKQLETKLRGEGLAVDVINAGKGGMGTGWYAEAAERIVPVLRPDLIIVAILQGDDLAQAIPLKPDADVSRGGAGSRAPLWKRVLKTTARGVCPNLLQRRESPPERPAGTIRTTWQKDATDRIARMTAPEKGWLGSLDPTVAQMFREGNLNPGLVTLALAEPDHLRMTLHPDEEKTRARVDGMVAHLERIRAVAARSHAQVLVVPVPYGAFVNRRQWDAIRRVGFQVEDAFLTSTLPDDVVRAAADRAGVPSTSAMAVFREQAGERELYFHWDGHFNPAGHELFAATLAGPVAAYFARTQ